MIDAVVPIENTPHRNKEKTMQRSRNTRAVLERGLPGSARGPPLTTALAGLIDDLRVYLVSESKKKSRPRAHDRLRV
jgi:hypothetical protein